jgi:hypothetical protein
LNARRLRDECWHGSASGARLPAFAYGQAPEIRLQQNLRPQSSRRKAAKFAKKSQRA